MHPTLSCSFSRKCQIFALLGLLLAPFLPAYGQCNFSDDKTPARGAPSQLWGELVPWDTGVLPSPRDNTDFDQTIGTFETHPYAFALDVEQNWIFLAQNRRFQIWKGSTLPGSFNVPEMDRSLTTMSNEGVQYMDSGHSFFVLQDIDAPPNHTNLVAIVGVDGMGLVVYDTTSKVAPSFLYQDHGGGRHALQVYAATIGSQHYAFVAGAQKTALPGGVFAYNMSAARNLTPPCVEARPAGPNLCPGVYQGKISSRTNVKYIDGVGNFIVFSSDFAPKGFEIWNVLTPSAPQRVMTGLPTESIHGVAMWQQGSNYYLALRTFNQARIYNVSCITGGNCILGSPLWTQSMTTPGSDRFVTFSRSGSTPFVHYGTSQECLSGDQHEWLFDVSNPSSPHDISPQGTIFDNGEPVSYWGWYYYGNDGHGFNHMAPRMGKFFGDYFFRAGVAIFDVHRRTGGSPPTARFSWSPTAIYPGTSVNFNDSSTGSPNAWDWDFEDGSPASSSQENPSGVTFGGTGNKTVQLEATNGAGSGNTSQEVPVLNPVPNIPLVTASPNPALVCQPVTFQAPGTTGQPPLSLTWEVKNDQNVTVDTGSGTSHVWQTSPSNPVGTYTGVLTATNGIGSDTGTSSVVTLNALPALPGSGTFAPIITSQNPPDNGAVDFAVSVAGATEWNWDFGDNPGGGPNNDGYEGWTSNPVDGPSPNHSYAVVGNYTVRVKVRNCIESEQESNALNVPIISVVQLVANFRANLFCTSGLCLVDQGVTIAFIDTSTGDPQLWDYDWDGSGGSGGFEDSGNSGPAPSHVYTQIGTFKPRLRIRSGSQSDIFEHAFAIQVGPAAPSPSVSVVGPTSGTVNQTLTYTASASNCSPSASGWTWTAAGASGSSTSASIQLSWSTPGSKSVTVRNSACGTATGVRSVNISGGGGGGVRAGAASRRRTGASHSRLP